MMIAEDLQYHQVKALPGDGIYSLLRRYELDKNSCNFDRFYELNTLKKNAALRAGQSYYLPILLYNFNGKTIRSSIGRNDWDLAIQIQEYNERMLEERLRDNSFKTDKVLWVPYHMLNCPDVNLDIPAPVSEEPELASEPVGNRKFPIFGDKYAYTPLKSNKLKGRVYYIVSGHGGPDPGAMGKRGSHTLCEENMPMMLPSAFAVTSSPTVRLPIWSPVMKTMGYGMKNTSNVIRMKFYGGMSKWTALKKRAFFNDPTSSINSMKNIANRG